MSKPILFISDLHLDPSRPQIIELFLRFLREQASQAQALYILGDFFEMWIGDDDDSELTKQIQAALKSLTQQSVPVFLMHGNRDFLLDKRFCKATGCKLLADPTKVELFGKPTLLMHGDLLCTDDVKYQHFRRRVRHPLFKSFYLHLPLRIRRWLAHKARAGSKKHTSTTAENIMDVNLDAVKTIMLKHNVKQLIHGHTHRPAIHNENGLTRIVLGDWHSEGSVLVCRGEQLPALNRLVT